MSTLQTDIDVSISSILDDFSKKKKFKLNKNKIEEITILSKPQTNFIKLNKEDIDNIKQKKLGEDLFRFRKKLYRHFSSNNLILLNNNIKSLKVKIRYITYEMLSLKFASGTYFLKKNKIELIKYFKDKCINHELLHMATSFYDKKFNIGFSGFQQILFYKKQSIGRGLNEGYTDLLAKRYFNEKVEDRSYSYDVCRFFSEKLEEIVGRKEMEQFYMNADLYGLYNYLINFDEGMNVATFIVTLDYILSHASIFNPKGCENRFTLIECYLSKWYIKKMEQQLNNGTIDENTFNKNIVTYINSLENEKLYIKNYIKENNQKKEYFK